MAEDSTPPHQKEIMLFNKIVENLKRSSLIFTNQTNFLANPIQWYNTEK